MSQFILNLLEECKYIFVSGFYKLLYVVVYFGLISWVECLFEVGVDVNEVCNGFILVQVVVLVGNRLEMMKFLFEKGVDLNLKFKWGFNVFYYWIRNDQQFEGVQLLF